MYFVFILCLCSPGWCCLADAMRSRVHVKVTLNYPPYMGWKFNCFHEPRDLILKGTLPFLNRKCPSSKYSKSGSPSQTLFESPPLFTFRIQFSRLQSTLLHQRFICYWHIELVDIVEIYIAPTFHIILQSLCTIIKISNNLYVTSLWNNTHEIAAYY